MAALHLEVQALTGVSTGTSPSNQEMADFLSDGVVNVINKVSATKPEELFKFATETSVTDGNGTTVNGQILSVVREQQADKFYPASEIPADLRYRATDSDSLYFRSEYNPCFYVLNGKIYILPAPSGSSTEGRISMLNYVTPAFDDTAIANFPNEYEPLVVLYASAMTCLHKASEIHNSLPTVPTFNVSPSLLHTDVALPEAPSFRPVGFDFSTIRDAEQSLKDDDLEMSSKHMDVLDKYREKFDAEMRVNEQIFNDEMGLFEKEIEVALQNADKKNQALVNQYAGDVRDYEQQVLKYTNELNEEVTEYNWYLGRYASFMNEYNNSVLFGMKPTQKGMPKEQGTGGE